MPNPPDIPVKETEHLTRFKAQLKFGLFAKWDYTMLSGIVAIWLITGFYWWFRPEPSFQVVIVALLASILLGIGWLIVLVYRVLVWVLDVQADINLLPQAAARIVAGYYEGRGEKR